ncbi:hypothetical protein [Enterococcus casseliflavus]|uniref:hypothetical protein n=1 Tax=Enterococcus casseliflavus TaxID=37734 RepID=UPI0022E011CD|nr:hypothetical protein [Enterococcus casseliflavus]MEB6085065.1 hypothetical protein [Enterococcus casseliflavus]
MNKTIHAIIQNFRNEMVEIVSVYQEKVESADRYADDYKKPIIEEATSAYTNQTVGAKTKALSAIQEAKENRIQEVTKEYFAPVDPEVLSALNLLEQVQPSKQELEILVTKYGTQPLVMRRLAQIAKGVNIMLPELVNVPTIDQVIEKINSPVELGKTMIKTINEQKPNLNNLTFNIGMQSLLEKSS